MGYKVILVVTLVVIVELQMSSQQLSFARSWVRGEFANDDGEGNADYDPSPDKKVSFARSWVRGQYAKDAGEENMDDDKSHQKKTAYARVQKSWAHDPLFHHSHDNYLKVFGQHSPYPRQYIYRGKFPLTIQQEQDVSAPHFEQLQ